MENCEFSMLECAIKANRKFYKQKKTVCVCERERERKKN